MHKHIQIIFLKLIHQYLTSFLFPIVPHEISLCITYYVTHAMYQDLCLLYNSKMQSDSFEKESSAGSKYNKTSSQNRLAVQFTFSTEGLPTIIGKKVAGIVEELNSDIINVDSLKAYLAVGVPDEATIIRQYCWKLVFGYLPPQKSKWAATVQKEANTYEGLVKMFLPSEKFQDYPLLLKKQHPRYAQLQNDFLLWEQIEKDTSRTHAQFSFFAAQSKQMMIPYLTSARRQKFKMIYGQDESAYQQFLNNKEIQRKTYRYDYMTRILYIYSKLNPKVQYVQGMNEILAPIFYLVNISKPANQIQEAACFFMFNNAICDILELHIKDLDKSRNGIYGKLNQVNEMLMVIDPQVWMRLDTLKIDPFFYCFRWVTLLYAQDFELFDTMRIWESLFSAEDRCLYINFFAIAIILACKDVILQNQFTVVLEALHNIKDLNIHETIQIADDLYRQHKNKDFSAETTRAKKAITKQRKRQQEQQQAKQLSEEERLAKEKNREQKRRAKLQRQKQREEKKKLKAIKEAENVETNAEQEKRQQKQKPKVAQQKQESNQPEKVQQEKPKKQGGIFKKFTNFVDKFRNNT